MSNKTQLQINNINLSNILSKIDDLPTGIPYRGDNPLVIGTEGFNLPANTLLKEPLQIANGAGAGVYLWEKYEIVGTKHVQLYTRPNPSSSDTVTYLEMSSPDGVDFENLSYTFLTGREVGFTYNGTRRVMTFPYVDEAYIDGLGPYTYYVGKRTTSSSSSYTARYMQIIWKDLAKSNSTFDLIPVEEKRFVGYIVDSKETAYPDNGYQEGFYYRKVASEPNMACGHVIIPNSIKKIEVSHGLLTVPRRFIFVSPSSSDGIINWAIATLNDEGNYPNSNFRVGGTYYFSYGSYYSPIRTKSYFIDLEKIIIEIADDYDHTFKGEYFWIAMA